MPAHPCQPRAEVSSLDSTIAGSLIERLRRPRIVAAIVLLSLTGGILLAFLYERGELAGADAYAYWEGVRRWLAGADPYDPVEMHLPYVYPPWTLLLFLPWALLPWEIAWFGWRAVNVVLFAGTVAWAYQRRPLPTALLLAVLGPALAANLDTGNVNVLIVVAIWVAQFTQPRVGGLLWALVTGLKWVPAPLIVLLPPRARAWGLAFVGVAIVLTLATWPLTLHQIDVALNHPRPVRLDYMILAWAAVPWLWRQRWRPWWLQRR
ncbi:MAG: DUF2029 domain-containing protein [Chloroflexota bacterium]|nr:DUF2029 domain-containing protein [Chloroflexota bacterium]